eukprot:3832401-Amphidinium_carterae.1
MTSPMIGFRITMEVLVRNAAFINGLLRLCFHPAQLDEWRQGNPFFLRFTMPAFRTSMALLHSSQSHNHTLAVTHHTMRKARATASSSARKTDCRRPGSVRIVAMSARPIVPDSVHQDAEPKQVRALEGAQKQALAGRLLSTQGTRRT